MKCREFHDRAISCARELEAAMRKVPISHIMQVNQTKVVLVLLCIAISWVMPTAAVSEETLYNGIRLPSLWPPAYRELKRGEPMPVPYLESPPSVVSIEVGRQLLVDDFLIETTTLRRTFHKARYHERNPVLEPERDWERESSPQADKPGMSAAPYSDGVWFDPQDQRFKAWYMGGYLRHGCLATSLDGIRWEKPELDVVPGTNIVFPNRGDTSLVWLDLQEPDVHRRFKLWMEEPKKAGQGIFYSADGIHWGSERGRTGRAASPSTVFWNPFRKVWVYSVRSSVPELGRYRRYWETEQPTKNIQWNEFPGPDIGPRSGKDPLKLPLWICADQRDTPYPGQNFPPELYNLDAVAYESLMLGLFSMLRGPETSDRPKIKEIVVGFSRDGFHWHRPHREPIIGISNDVTAWNAGNIQSVGGCCLIVHDELRFYVSGRRIASGKQICSMGLAVLRRDGFASMDAGAQPGVLTTRPLHFRGSHLFVNVSNPDGELRVEVLDEKDQVIPEFSIDRCVPVRVDSTCQLVEWRGVEDISKIKGRTIKLRFQLTSGQLYSFWISPDRSGASHGYVAAGGPGFNSAVDSLGRHSPNKFAEIRVTGGGKKKTDK